MAVFRRIRVNILFYAVGADDSVRPQELPVLRKPDANPKHFNGPMWASAPTNDHGKTPDFEGGQGRPPLQMVLKNRVWVEKPPRLPFRAVGVDAHIDPPETPVFTEIRCEFETFQWADVGIGPYKRPRNTQRFSILRRRGGRLCPPAGNARFYGNPMRIRSIGVCQLPASSVQRMTGAPMQKSVPFCTVIFAPSIRFS